MNYTLSPEMAAWLDAIYGKLAKKLSAECDRIGDRIPYISENGVYSDDKAVSDIFWWTNGFWPGMLWQMYHATGEDKYRHAAESVELKLVKAFEGYEGLHHDVGFMYLHSSVANYRLTGSEKARTHGRHAANLLAGRYNPLGKFIRAWNEDRAGWIIIDCMMNIPLLYWASEDQNDPRFKAMALDHADTAMKKLIRSDGSSSHIGCLDPDNGDVLELPGGQGYAPGSSWTRGQAWALYGFALSYEHTKKREYLDTAKNAAHYFIANAAQSGYKVVADFRAPAIPVKYDNSAALCAVCGLLEIARHVDEYERPLYVESAIRLLEAVDREFCNWNPEYDSIVSSCCDAYFGEFQDAPIIYADYFLTEAILRLKGKDFLIW